MISFAFYIEQNRKRSHHVKCSFTMILSRENPSARLRLCVNTTRIFLFFWMVAVVKEQISTCRFLCFLWLSLLVESRNYSRLCVLHDPFCIMTFRLILVLLFCFYKILNIYLLCEGFYCALRVSINPIIGYNR